MTSGSRSKRCRRSVHRRMERYSTSGLSTHNSQFWADVTHIYAQTYTQPALFFHTVTHTHTHTHTHKHTHTHTHTHIGFLAQRWPAAAPLAIWAARCLALTLERDTARSTRPAMADEGASLPPLRKRKRGRAARAEEGERRGERTVRQSPHPLLLLLLRRQRLALPRFPTRSTARSRRAGLSSTCWLPVRPGRAEREEEEEKTRKKSTRLTKTSTADAVYQSRDAALAASVCVCVCMCVYVCVCVPRVRRSSTHFAHCRSHTEP